MQGYVLGAVLGRIAVLVGIDTEHTEVTRLPGPHPVVGISAKLAQCLGGREHQSHIAIYLIYTHIVGVATIVGLHLAVHSRVGLHIVGLDGCTDAVGLVAVDMACLLSGIGLVDAVEGRHHACGTLLGAHQELDKESLGRAFLAALVRHETIGEDVILGGGERLDGSVAAVMIGKHESVGTHHHA